MRANNDMSVIARSAIGYAHHRIICDSSGNPVDYEFLNVNPAFERYLGMTAEDIIGKRASELISDFRESSFNRAEVYGNVALNGAEIELEQYSVPLGKYVHIEAFSLKRGYFSMLVYDISRFIQKISVVEESLREILDSTAEGIYGVDREGRCTFCNASGLRMLGYDSIDELIGQNMHALTHRKRQEKDQEKAWPKSDENDESDEGDECIILDACLKGEQIHLEHFSLIRKDGTEFATEYFVYPQYRNGVLSGCVSTFIDITERLEALRELEQSERSKAVLLSNLPGMAYRCKDDADWTMEFVSDGCYELTGYKPESLLNNRDLSFNDMIDPCYREELRRHWDTVIRSRKRFKHEYPIITATGVAKWVLEQGQVIYGDGGKVEALEGFIIDITDQKLQQHEIEYLNRHDNLTGLYNRIYYEIAKQRFDSKEYLPLSIIVGDVDGLKNINAEYGLMKGDRILMRIGKIMGLHTRAEDVLARTGGDSFSMILPGTDTDEAYSIMQNIAKDFEEHDFNGLLEGTNIHVSLGVGTRVNMEQDIEAAVNMAEEYMKMRKLLERGSSQSTIIELFKVSMYERSRETRDHAERLAHLAHKIGQKLRLTQLQLDELELLATLHDIGKMGVDNHILDKPGPLTSEEWVEMKKHPEIGYRIAISNPGLQSIADYILYHHERWDGAGYPQGLAGEAIPMHSRILAIVDAYDAMTSDRTYRKAMTEEEAMEEIRKNSGTQFDPELVAIFLDYLNSLRT